MNWELAGNIAFWVFVGGAFLLILGMLAGRFLKAHATVMAEPTPEQRDWRVPVLRDIPHPERYPKTWAYRAAKGAEETTEIRVEVEP